MGRYENSYMKKDRQGFCQIKKETVIKSTHLYFRIAQCQAVDMFIISY